VIKKTIDVSDCLMVPVINALLQLGLSKSKTEARRMIQQKAVDIKDDDGTIYTAELTGDKSWIHNGSTIKYGKHIFKKVVMKNPPQLIAECIELEPGDDGYEPD
jgi:tyrosyl-tRNA synthetase